MESRIKLPSISELTKSHDVKLPDLSNYTSPSYNPAKLPSLTRLSQFPSTGSAPPVAHVVYNSGNYHYQPMNQPPIQAVSPPLPSHHLQQSPSLLPQQQPQSMATTPPQAVQTNSYNYYIPYYPVYYGQSPSPQQQYLTPEVINKPINKCHRCGTTETPEWRRGPNGVRTLCNACGLYHAKLVKRKGAAIAAQEVLNNKVCKGKNGRRISIKKSFLNSKMI